MSITVKDLAAKLASYALQYPNDEVMIAHEDVAFSFGRGDTNQAMSFNGDTKRFLVLMPDEKGDRLVLKRQEIV